ncbi:hypothetical protein [uncultured Cohaesibacter sp.]|uniref:hypothetical protein n=1 Tax=uncultured Cohaesibacter sp. TaxID=1002546 RepID=UPI0029C67A4A|nr:hypothetical protein [uncultured Cohaesibacter sp.]
MTDPLFPQWQPMRSMLLVSVRDDSDLPAAYRWLYKHHVNDSISQFAPYVTKYSTYRALPLSPSAEDFGTYNFIMTEHYWLIDPFNGGGAPKGVAFTEHFNDEYLTITRQPTGMGLRPGVWTGSREGYHPTAFMFLPIYWEHEYKGPRSIEDGPNYRWIFTIAYPDGVDREEADKWFHEEFMAAFCALPQVTRALSSPVLDNPRKSPFHRLAEIWFENSREWESAVETVWKTIPKPDWATHDRFPFFEPYKDCVSIFLLDRPESDHLEQFRGYNTTR